jgi:hypothetical protein
MCVCVCACARVCVCTETGFAKFRERVQEQCRISKEAGWVISDAMTPHFPEIHRGSSEGLQGATVFAAFNSAKEC